MHTRTTTVLVLVDSYLPGHRGGGTIRSVANLVERLGDELDFKIITANQDSHDARPYADIVADRWARHGKAAVLHLSRRRRSPRAMAEAIRAVPHDVLYLNSFFSPRFSIQPLVARRLGLIPRARLVVAPRGELSPAALSLKTWKKQAYRRVAGVLSLYRDALWQASTEYEEADIARALGTDARILVAPDYTVAPVISPPPRPAKTSGRLAVAFLGRIARMKNLSFAITSLFDLRGEVDLDVYGPTEDPKYAQECEQLARAAPASVRVRFRGEVSHPRVAEVLAAHHLLYLPTLGENFGHTIVESLTSGCPVLISDRTPWRQLQDQGAGWDFPLHQPQSFTRALQECLDLDAAGYARLSAGAAALGRKISEDERTVALHRSLFAGASRASGR